MQIGEITEPKIDQAGPVPNREFTYVDISSVDNNAKRIVEPKRLPADSAPSRARQRLRSGDVLVSMTRPNLNAVALVPPDLDGAIGSTGFHVLRGRDGVLPQWLYYGVQTRQFVGAMSEVVQGALYPAVRPKDVRAFDMPMPALDEQRRIVAEIEKQFSCLDEAVASLKRIKANAHRLASSVLAEAVAGRLVPSTGASWRTLQVCEAGEVVLGRQRAPQYLTGRWPRKYLRVANIKDDTIDYSDVETMDFDDAQFAKYQLVPGDILVSEGQSPELLGQSAIFRGFIEPLCFQKTLHRFRADPQVTTPEFAQIVFRSHVRSGVFRRLGSITTNIGHLTLEKFKAASFPLPPLDEQCHIVAEVDRRLSIVREVMAELDANLKRAVALRQSVLAQAFGFRTTEV
jgi:type I restriction enzyme S subunit